MQHKSFRIVVIIIIIVIARCTTLRGHACFFTYQQIYPGLPPRRQRKRNYKNEFWKMTALRRSVLNGSDPIRLRENSKSKGTKYGRAKRHITGSARSSTEKVHGAATTARFLCRTLLWQLFWKQLLSVSRSPAATKRVSEATLRRTCHQVLASEARQRRMSPDASQQSARTSRVS